MVWGVQQVMNCRVILFSNCFSKDGLQIVLSTASYRSKNIITVTLFIIYRFPAPQREALIHFQL